MLVGINVVEVSRQDQANLPRANENVLLGFLQKGFKLAHGPVCEFMVVDIDTVKS